MRCPACQAPASEYDALCRQCAFTLETADRALGVPPVLRGPVADPGHVLRAAEVRRMQRAIKVLEQRLPQVRMAVVVTEIPAGVPPGVFTFWIFNRGGLSSAVAKGGACRLVLLLMDSRTWTACAMIGYGLEPVFSSARLEACLEKTTMLLEARKPAQAAEAFAYALAQELTEAAEALPRVFGWQPDELWLDATAVAGDEALAPASDALY